MINTIPRDTFYFLVRDGQRRVRYSYYSGPAPLPKALKPGETIEGPRKCPYLGCPCGPEARPPCGLCYE